MSAPQLRKDEKGFTLIELLIVIAIIGFLAAAVLVAVDPVKRIQDARDARRFAEVNGVLNAVLTKQVDDRAIYNGVATAPIITSTAKSQVIVTSSAGVVCDTGLTISNYPGCAQALDTTVSATTLTGTVTGSTTSITGSGTLFVTELKVGDVIYVAATPAKSCTVSAIATNTALTCASAPATAFAADTAKIASKNCVANFSDAFSGPGTITSAAAVVTGTNTNFSNQLHVGDTVSDGTNSCTVASITSATLFTCTGSPTPGAFSAATYTVTLSNPLTPTYIASVPTDPRGTGTTICTSGCTTNASGVTTLGTNNTGYYIHRSTGNRVEIGSCSPEDTATNPTITVKR